MSYVDTRACGSRACACEIIPLLCKGLQSEKELTMALRTMSLAEKGAKDKVNAYALLRGCTLRLMPARACIFLCVHTDTLATH
jgi:hypothetical protein